MATCTKQNNETNPSPKKRFQIDPRNSDGNRPRTRKALDNDFNQRNQPHNKAARITFIEKNSRQGTSTNSNSSLSGPLWPSEMLVFEGPSSFDDLTLSLMDSKKQMDNDGLAITVITWIVMFALHWGLVGCNVCNKGLGGSKSNIQSTGSPNVSVDCWIIYRLGGSKSVSYLGTWWVQVNRALRSRQFPQAMIKTT